MSIFQIGGVPGFEPKAQDISVDFAALTAPPLNFRTIEAARDLSPAARSVLENFAAWNLVFPCVDPKVGRTFHAALTDSARNAWPDGVLGIKAKGIGGLEYARDVSGADRWRCVRPDGTHQYGKVAELIFRIDEGLKFEVLENDPKALHCISTRRAQVEFRVQEELAKVDLGQRGLLVGEYLARNGGKAHDLHDQPIGAVFSGYDRRFVILSNLISLHLDEPAGQLCLLERDRLAGLDMTGEGAWKAFVLSHLLYEKMGEAKIRAATEAHVAGHDGHVGNFLFDPSSGKILVTDTDSCLDFRALPPERKGPQLLRDLSADLNLVLSDSSERGYTQTYLRRLNEAKPADNPALAFLRGYFRGRLDDSQISAFAERVCKEYATFLAEREATLGRMALLLRSGQLRPEATRVIVMNWMLQHRPFLVNTVSLAYDMIRASNLQAQGFVLPKIEPLALKRNTSDGVVLLLQRVVDLNNAYMLSRGQAALTFDRRDFGL